MLLFEAKSRTKTQKHTLPVSGDVLSANESCLVHIRNISVGLSVDFAYDMVIMGNNLAQPCKFADYVHF